jgi:3'-phosphoadenosine 5'-phosphosulfate sulfotransferase (PAPS reductase)/FAD synthetase
MKILVFYSGGKDSQASMIWSVKKYGADMCEAVFCDTGWENPATYEHIKETTGQLGVKLVTLKNKKYFPGPEDDPLFYKKYRSVWGKMLGMIYLAIKKKRFPSTKARFCTEELKSKPAIDYVLSQTENVIVIEGIRKNESFSRSLMTAQCTYFKYYFEPLANGKTHSYRKKEIVEWCKHYNADKLRPVFDWTAQQTIDYIRENGQQPNPLYFMGFTRVGCFPCIMSRQGAIKRIIENHPEQWKFLKEKEAEIGTTFFPPSYIPNWAATGRTKGGKVFCTAEDIEKYLRNKNLTGDLFDDDTPSCMSAYGLCE